MYVGMYVRTQVGVYVCAGACLFACTALAQLQLWLSGSMRVCMCACTHACFYACIHACMGYVHMYAGRHVCSPIRQNVHWGLCGGSFPTHIVRTFDVGPVVVNDVHVLSR